MRDDMDDLMARLAASGPERSLDGFEDAVMRGVARSREEVRTRKALSSYRIASVSLALVVGMTAGGMAAATTATQDRQVSPFSTAAHLAPSTLLEGGN